MAEEYLIKFWKENPECSSFSTSKRRNYFFEEAVLIFPNFTIQQVFDALYVADATSIEGMNLGGLSEEERFCQAMNFFKETKNKEKVRELFEPHCTSIELSNILHSCELT